MTPIRFLFIILILAGASFAWFILGSALSYRTQVADEQLSETVGENWGLPMVQRHPEAFFLAPTAARTRRQIQPETSRIEINLQSDPKKKGLIWYRTYTADFDAEYTLSNPTPITQTFYVAFTFPADGVRFDQFSFSIGDEETKKAPVKGKITESVILAPGETVPVRLTYTAAGLDRWTYAFDETERVQNVDLIMRTNFDEFDIPAGSESPTSRNRSATDGWTLTWNYSNVIGANAIAMEMPAVTNPGPVASRITFFAPVSLLFFFAVLLVVAAIQKVSLHPMNYFLLAAGCFAFQLLFAYLVDLLPVTLSFAISAITSLILVSGYLWAAAGLRFARIAALAQFAYMVLFSYSFFFDGLTGITITIGAIITLALLMAFTARTNWGEVFRSTTPKPKSSPPVIPTDPAPEVS
ncbi:MAG: inner membrane CreD family protein [Verrucomicrobiota bacterium]